MSAIGDTLEVAAFPEEFTEVVAVTLSVTKGNFLAVKDTLGAVRGLTRDQFQELLGQLSVAV